jgi:hypothetical protein
MVKPDDDPQFHRLEVNLAGEEDLKMSSRPHTRAKRDSPGASSGVFGSRAIGSPVWAKRSRRTPMRSEHASRAGLLRPVGRRREGFSARRTCASISKRLCWVPLAGALARQCLHWQIKRHRHWRPKAAASGTRWRPSLLQRRTIANVALYRARILHGVAPLGLGWINWDMGSQEGALGCHVAPRLGLEDSAADAAQFGIDPDSSSLVPSP